MGRKYIFHVLLVCLTCLFINVKAQISSIPDYSGTTKYPYWGTYIKTPMSQVKAATWIDSTHVINDWDWSLPGYVKAPKKSTFSMLRNSGLNDSKLQTLVKPDFPCKPTVAHWIKWADLEAVEGTFTFDKLIANIRLCAQKGYLSIVRIHTAATIFAPAWLNNYGIAKITYPDATIINFDVTDPKFHNRYLKLVAEIGKSGIPNMPEVAGLYVGYASKSLGDEGIGPYHNTTTGNDTVKHVKERLDAWATICKGVENKVFMGGPTDYGQSLGFGLRRGFVEHYLYTLPDNNIGQQIDASGYIYVNETRPIIAQNLFHGEENEEYEDRYATAENDFQYGTSTEPFQYRYFWSNIRLLQMRCNELLNYEYALMPKLLAWVGMELGRTIDETPDIWCFLRESYISGNTRKPVKNFERWLFQRDKTGYETTPVVPIEHGYITWMVANDRRFDYIAREGKKIGFNVDQTWPGLVQKIAFKITVIDNSAGTLNLKYSDGTTLKTISKPLLGDNILRTYTFFVSDFKANSNVGSGFDFTLESESSTKKITVSTVRLVQAEDPTTPKFTITTSLSSPSAGTVTGGGLYYQNQSITVSATSNPWYVFTNWTENGDVVSSAVNYTFSVDKARVLVANYTAIPKSSNLSLISSWIQGSTNPKVIASNTALVVMLYGEGTGDISAATVSYGGQLMTKVIEKSFNTGTGSSSYTGAFVLNEAEISAATSSAITTTWNTAPSGGSDIVSAFFANVNQTTPYGASASNGISGTTITASSLSTNAGDVVLVAGTAGNNGTYTINNGFTRGIPETSASFGDITSAFKEATGNDEIPSLTMSGSMRQTIIGFVLKKDDTVIPQFTIKATAGSNGSISPIDSVSVNSGDSQTYNITPNSGYDIDDVKVDGNSQGAIATYTFTNVVANHTISVTFKAKPYNIKVTVGSNGSILPTGSVLINGGANLIFNIVPNSGYEVDDVMVNGSSQGAITSYSYINATPNITINATFKPVVIPPVETISIWDSEIPDTKVCVINRVITGMGLDEDSEYRIANGAQRIALCPLSENNALLLNPKAADYMKDEDVAGNFIKVYPNPVLNTLYINHPESSTIHILNPKGQLIFNKKVTGLTTNINVEDLKINGLIFVRVLTSKNSFTVKVFVIK